MILRATLILLAMAGLSASAATPATYNRTENFATSPKNWRHFHPNQFYGYYATLVAGGKGAAGGLFLPKTYFNYYADTSLNGTFTRGTPITAAGRLALQAVSGDPLYTNSTYICHFSRGSNGFINTLGIAFTGYNADNVLCRAIIEFADGTAFIGNSIGLPVGANTAAIDYTYTWTPTGGTQGFGSLVVQVGGATGPKSTINLTKTSAGLDFALDSFGLFQPPFKAPNSNTYLQLATSKLVYTALAGKAPKLRVNAPQTIQTTTSPLVLTGTAKTSLGNRVTSVRYRVVKAGKVGSYHRATGTTNWSATIRVPAGASRIDIQATGDNGLTSQTSRKVQLAP